jgi:hypothetical protein
MHGKGRNHMVWSAIAALLVLLAYALWDGGREPVHEISQTIAMPGAKQ